MLSSTLLTLAVSYLGLVSAVAVPDPVNNSLDATDTTVSAESLDAVDFNDVDDLDELVDLDDSDDFDLGDLDLGDLGDFEESAGSLQSLNPRDTLHQLSKRACFKTGASFGNYREAARSAARNACNVFWGGRNFARGDWRTTCYYLSPKLHVRFRVSLTGHNAPKSRKLGLAECKDGLIKEINNCGRGGQSRYGNWYYRADPNNGLC